MSAKRSKLEDKVQASSGSSSISKEAGVKEMDIKSSKKNVLVKKPKPTGLSRPIISSKNIKYCVICRSSPSAFDMSHKRVAGLRFKMYKKLHASFGFPSAESKELHFCCQSCFESVNRLHNLQEKPKESETEIKEVAVKIRTAVQTRIPVNLELAKSFGDCRSETVARPNRTRSTAKTNNGNSSTVTSEEVGLDDDIKIKIEIKMEDEEIKEEIIEEESDNNSLMEQPEDDNYQQKIAAHCTRSNKSNVSQFPLDPLRLVLVNWDGCIICRSGPSAFDMKNKRVAERRFEIYKKLDSSYQLPTAESTEAKFHFCCETCFKAVNHLHSMQVKLGKVEAEIKAVVARIHNSILTKTPATLELGKLKDCGDKVGRQNRSGIAAPAAESENSILGDDDFIKMEIKEDEIKQENIEETDNDDNLMDYDSRARGTARDKESGTVGSRRNAAAGKLNKNSTVDIEDITRIEIDIKIEDEIKQEIIEEDDFLSEDSLSGQGNDQRKLIPATSSQIQINCTVQSHQIPRLKLVTPDGNDADAMELDDMNVDEALENSTTVLENNLPDFSSENPEEQLKESLVPMLPKKRNSANRKSNGKSDTKRGTRQELSEASAIRMSSQKNKQKTVKCKIELQCYFCSKKFLNQSKLMQHTVIHTLERPYKCTICNVRFNQISHLNHHVEVIHNDLKPFECTIKDCSYRSGNKTNLTIHLRCHTGEKPFKCHLCELSFGYHNNRRAHINAVHKKLKPHKCTRKGCTSRFPNSSDLRRHINAVHKGLKLFLCTVDGCAFRCTHKRNLNAHMLAHGEKKFMCGMCKTRFVSKSNLSRHQKKYQNKCQKMSCTKQ